MTSPFPLPPPLRLRERLTSLACGTTGYTIATASRGYANLPQQRKKARRVLCYFRFLLESPVGVCQTLIVHRRAFFKFGPRLQRHRIATVPDCIIPWCACQYSTYTMLPIAKVSCFALAFCIQHLFYWKSRARETITTAYFPSAVCCDWAHPTHPLVFPSQGFLVIGILLRMRYQLPKPNVLRFVIQNFHQTWTRTSWRWIETCKC